MTFDTSPHLQKRISEVVAKIKKETPEESSEILHLNAVQWLVKHEPEAFDDDYRGDSFVKALAGS